MKHYMVKGALVAALGILGAGAGAFAQQTPPRADALDELAAYLGDHPPAKNAKSPKQDAPIDLTGNWVAIVNEEWRWRMMTPPHGDYASVPLNPAGKAKADTWSTAQDGSCKAFGVGGVMRMPTRLRISWVGEDQLKIETDNGEQMRTINFNPAKLPAHGTKSLQGRSLAVWEHSMPFGDGGLGGAPGNVKPQPGGDLKVITDDMSEGWLRRNGVPYSEKTRVTEYYDRFPGPDGSEWFVVTTVIDDPTYLRAQFVTSSNFRREPDGAKWHPAPCKP